MPLSPQETQVLALADQGKSYKEISAELHISVHTVKTYAQRIIVKTMATCLDNAAYLRRQANCAPGFSASATQRT